MELLELQQRAHQTAVDKHWWTLHRNFGDFISLFHTELSEAFEEYRKGKALGEIYYENGEPKGVPIELADLIIRIADFCEHYRISLTQSVSIKMTYNETRPLLHGGKRV